jgi:putative ABC transport system permease protein
MERLRIFIARLRALFRRDAVLQDIEEELRLHVEMEAENLVERGAAAEEAASVARRSFGNLGRIRDLAYDVRGAGMLETLWQDLRFGLRMLIKKPGFTLTAVLTLALGIGANTAIFSVVNAVLLTPLPYPASDRLVFVSEHTQQVDNIPVAWPNFLDWREQNNTMEQIGVYNRDSYNLTGGGDPERLPAAQVSADLLSALGVGAALGRIFSVEEDQPGSSPVALLSYALWQRKYGGDPNILDRTIILNDRGYTVIGVLPAGFQFPGRVDLWLPAGQLSGTDWRNRGNHPGLSGVARLKPGVTIEQARADLDAIALRLEEQYPDTNRDHRVALAPLLDAAVDGAGSALWLLLGASALVVAVACANVANLLLVRAAGRRREIAVRMALGATRARLVRQLLTESVMLALLGGAAGCLLANWGVKLLIAMAAACLPRAGEIHVSGPVLGFAAAASILTGILFGLAPAWQAGKVWLQDTLKAGDRGLIPSGGPVRGALIVCEMALALVLLAGTGLLLRSFYNLNKVDSGFDYDHLRSFSLSLPDRRYPDPEQRTAFYLDLTRKLAALPGVQSVALASGLPFGNSSWRPQFAIEGRPVPPQSELPYMEACLVSPDYFTTMGIPLRSGRYFTEQDNRQHLAGRNLTGIDKQARQMAGVNAVIIDEEFARRYWPDENAVGKFIRLAPVSAGSPLLSVVGVVGRVKMDRLSADSSRVQCYFPSLQLPFSGMTVIVKSNLEQGEMLASAREQVQALDSRQPIYNPRAMEQLRADSIAPERLNLTLISLFAAVALVLAAVGIYGVVSYSASQRTHEIGIRMALGAQRSDVLKLMVRQGMALTLIGLGIGLSAALGLTPLMKGMVFGISPADPLTFAATALLLTGVALAACYLPARRATKINPLDALRHE